MLDPRRQHAAVQPIHILTRLREDRVVSTTPLCGEKLGSLTRGGNEDVDMEYPEKENGVDSWEMLMVQLLNLANDN
jgi:hypothetical protein